MSDTNYNYLENTLQKINQQYIALQDSEEKKNSSILINVRTIFKDVIMSERSSIRQLRELLKLKKYRFVMLDDGSIAVSSSQVVDQVLTKMKENKLFKALYRKQYSGGSYYCGLKVGKPDEYDIDLLFELPTLCNPKIINSDVDGFVHIQMQDMEKFFKQLLLFADYPGLKEKLMDEYNNLSTENVLDWMESVINKALNQFKIDKRNVYRFAKLNEYYYVTLRKQGPAFTLSLYQSSSLSSSSYMMSVDLVPCFVFTDKVWPEYPYRANPTPKKNEFFVVPKRIPHCFSFNNSEEMYWRLSFQEQENEIIKSSQNLKPALRLLKRIRDAWDHKAVSSYYIKTIFLWKIEQNDINWNRSLSYVFMTMLKTYQQYIQHGNIPYYWNDNLNLLYGADPIYLINTSYKLKKIINDLERYQESPQRIEKCFYGPNWIEGMIEPECEPVQTNNDNDRGPRMQPESMRYSDLSRVKTDNGNKDRNWLIILIMMFFIYLFGISKNSNS